MRPVILVRYGEIGLKGKNRASFESRLIANMRRALAGSGAGPVRNAYGRVLVDPGPSPAEVLRRLRRVFGIVSLSPALRVDLDPALLEPAAERVVAASLARSPAATFKIDARRAYKSFPLTSQEINEALGTFVRQRFPGLSVKLDDPDLVLSVEVRSEGSYLSAERVPGPGGLPVGVSSRALLLLSGGIDSPVAGWMAMKRGVALVALHFHSPPFTGPHALQKVKDLCRALGEWGGPIPLVAVRLTEAQKEIRARCPQPLGITILRRVMLRVAEALALREGIPALVTGESVGQVASQTLESLTAIEAVTRLPVLRPLVGFDKVEIVERARRIGTYDISVRPYEDCCTLFVPPHPETRPRVERVARAEAALDVEGLVDQALASAERVAADEPLRV